uniref:DCL protein n=2 Tax=Kalanchoe fedtschenkoi TaxID=63787 RepID=A0A7N0SXH3_KALFE
MASRVLLRRVPLSHLRHLRHLNIPATSSLSPFLRRRFSSPADSFSRSSLKDDVWSSDLGDRLLGSDAEEQLDEADEEKWRAKESEVWKDIESTVKLAKEILHSGRYNCGDQLSREDEEAIVNKLLTYHPNHKDKIGCGVDYITIDWHPEYRRSKCFFVVRRDGSGEDFSYRKCLRSYVEHKYPSDAERFISLHFTKYIRQTGTASLKDRGACLQ